MQNYCEEPFALINILNKYARSISTDDSTSYWGYAIMLVYPDEGISYRRLRDSEFRRYKYAWYFGSAKNNRIEERIDEELTPEFFNGDRNNPIAWTDRHYCEDGRAYQAYWLTRAQHWYGAKLYLIGKFRINAFSQEEANKIWDHKVSEVFEAKYGQLAFGK